MGRPMVYQTVLTEAYELRLFRQRPEYDFQDAQTTDENRLAILRAPRRPVPVEQLDLRLVRDLRSPRP
jgi:hypothetical protein